MDPRDKESISFALSPICIVLVQQTVTDLCPSRFYADRC
jgi:hypothetical protein